MTPSLETALITGGSTGIGRALAHALARRGTRVVIVARRPEPLAEARSAFPDLISTLEADVADPDVATAVVAEAKAKLGALDLVVASAGFGVNKPAAKLQPKDVVSVFRLNVIGACATLTAAIPDMVAARRGCLVGISSVAGARGLPASAAYSASKAALSTFLESLRVDLRGSGVTVVDIRPGFVDTPLTRKNRFRMPFLLSAEEAGQRILQAIERERSVYTFPWQMAAAMQLLRWVPGWVYERMGARARQRGT